MRGAALTSRPIIGDAWERRCEEVGVDYHVASSLVSDLIQASARHEGGRGIVVLVDQPLGYADNITALRAAGAVVLLLAPPVLSPALRSSLSAGVDGLVTTSDSLEVVRQALETLVADGSYASPSGARLLLAEQEMRSRRAAAPPAVALPEREREVLRAMVDGLTVKATARHLGIAVKTVEAHRTRIFTRLGVHSQREAVTRALTDPTLLGRD